MKVQSHSSSEPAIQYSQDKTPLLSQTSVMTLLISLEVVGRNIMQFQILEGKAGKEIPQSYRQHMTII